MTVATSPATVGGIERRENPPYEEFVRNFMRPNRPVIVTNALTHWRANGRWTPKFFRDHYGDKVVCIDREYRLAEFIDLVEASSPEQPAPYLFHLQIDENFPELLGDFQPWPAHVAPNWLGQKFLPGNVGRRIADHDRPGVFIGGLASSSGRPHFDLQYHSYSFQLYGRKRFWLFPPEQTAYFYPDPADRCRSLIRDIERPDLAQFPLFARASAQVCDLEAGEFIFIPGGWWHSTRLLTPSISISINTANATNWPNVVRQLHSELKGRHPFLSRPFAAYMRVVGMWKGLCDRVGLQRNSARSTCSG